MKKIISIVLISVLLLNTLPLTANANTTIDYDAMSEYDGFAKAVFDSYVTGTTYVAGKYTNNLEYVNRTIGQIKDNASSLWEGFKNEDCGEGCNWGWEFIKQLLAGGATAIDIIKDFFTDEVESALPGANFYEQFFFISDNSMVVKSGYALDVFEGTISRENVSSVAFVINNFDDTSSFRLIHPSVNGVSDTLVAVQPIMHDFPYTVDSFVTNMFEHGVTFRIRDSSTQQEVKPPAPKELGEINDYIQNNPNGIHPEYKPQIIPELVCPDLTTNLTIVGTDIKLDGQILDVNKTTGQTLYNDQECIVNFTSTMPQITDDNKLVVDNGNGTRTDIETNEKIDSNGSIIQDINGNPDNCDGILCFMSSLVKAIGGMVSAIVNAITGLIDMLFHLIVPENLDFITDLFDSLKTTFTEKFAIATDLQNLFKSIFTESTTNPLTDLSFTLPATETQLSFSVFSVVDNYVPMIKRIISALLGLMTLMYVYRKITGSGGVMEK